MGSLALFFNYGNDSKHDCVEEESGGVQARDTGSRGVRSPLARQQGVDGSRETLVVEHDACVKVRSASQQIAGSSLVSYN
jgi:hypothetical protein